MMQRRTMLKLLGAGGLALATRRSLFAEATAAAPEDFFIFVHAAGGWDVTLWADPRNEAKGLIAPASTTNTDISGMSLWKPAAAGGGAQTFEILEATDTQLRLGPAIGALYDLRSRLTIVNGIAMNTVSHDDGVIYSMTGRHRAGGTVPASSIDVLVTNELGSAQLMPDVSIRFPSHFIGSGLDRRAIPLRVTGVDAITKSFTRSSAFLGEDDRKAIDALLSDEATTLARGSTHPEPYQQIASQHDAMPRLLGGDFAKAFDTKTLRAGYPQFNYGLRTQGDAALGAAFAVEAIKRNLVRCVAFSLGGLDTHSVNYKQHAHTLQDLFGVIANLVRTLDDTPHPTRANTRLSERTHILVLSDFCRSPQINIGGGRDHYPNNSALMISPRLRGGQSFGRTDPEQLLPAEAGTFTDGKRAVTPADVLATFLAANKIDPRRYLRDGEAIKSLLA